MNEEGKGEVAEFSEDTLHDFVIAHGYGAPTEEGLALGARLLAKGGDYARAAAEIVYRGLVAEGDEVWCYAQNC